MADTIECVSYRPAGKPAFTGGFAFQSYKTSRHEVLEETVGALGLADDLRRLFPATRPVWYGLWIESPLTPERRKFLERLFTAIGERDSRYQRELTEFLGALRESQQSGIPLEVQLSPPGHVDMGHITTFVHCPRCKVAGPFKPWQDAYPTESTECATCGHWYSPAATYSFEKMYFASSVHCAQCGESHRIKDFAEADRNLLAWQDHYRDCYIELFWLARIVSYYRRHPKLRRKEDRVIDLTLPQFDASSILRPLLADEMTMEEASQLLAFTTEADSEGENVAVRKYLTRNHFWLTRRLEACQETLTELGPQVNSQYVKCPTCGWGLAPNLVEQEETAPEGSAFIGVVAPNELEKRNCRHCEVKLWVQRQQPFPPMCVKCIEKQECEERAEKHRHILRQRRLPTIVQFTTHQLFVLALPLWEDPEMEQLRTLECFPIGRDGDIWRFAIPGEWPPQQNEYFVIVEKLRDIFSCRIRCAAVPRTTFEQALQLLHRERDGGALDA